MTDRVFEINVGVHCTEDQLHELVDRIGLTICPDPDHAPPCPVPWSIGYRALDDGQAAVEYPELVEQAWIEKY